MTEPTAEKFYDDYYQDFIKFVENGINPKDAHDFVAKQWKDYEILSQHKKDCVFCCMVQDTIECKLYLLVDTYTETKKIKRFNQIWQELRFCIEDDNLASYIFSRDYAEYIHEDQLIADSIEMWKQAEEMRLKRETKLRRLDVTYLRIPEDRRPDLTYGQFKEVHQYEEYHPMTPEDIAQVAREQAEIERKQEELNRRVQQASNQRLGEDPSEWKTLRQIEAEEKAPKKRFGFFRR
jgi:hypothetical protein